jgi:putative hydrolase of the HAD superfamily
LHHASIEILPRVNRAMTDFVARFLTVDFEQAQHLRKTYWRQYGATLTGMQVRHGVNAHEFLRDTHVFPDLSQLVKFNPQLVRQLRGLPGRKIIVTNAPRAYAMGVLRHSGLVRVFSQVVCIEDMQFAGRWQPKPSRSMMQRLLAKLRISASKTWLIEDTISNLHGVRRTGVRGIWVRQWSFDKFAKPYRSGAGRKVSVQVQSVKELFRLKI